MTPSSTRTRPHRSLLIGAAFAALLVSLALADSIDLLMPVLTAEGAVGIGRVETAINAIKGPATITVGSLAGLGVIAASAMMAVGAQSGPKLAILSVGSIFAIALGNGLIL